MKMDLSQLYVLKDVQSVMKSKSHFQKESGFYLLVGVICWSYVDYVCFVVLHFVVGLRVLRVGKIVSMETVLGNQNVTITGTRTTW